MQRNKKIYKVDKETGIVVQRREEGTKINNSKEDYTITWKIQLDKVTEENVMRLDVSKYDGYTIYNNCEK